MKILIWLILIFLFLRMIRKSINIVVINPQTGYPREKTRKEGTVTIEKKDSNSSRNSTSGDDGDYVDFEEIK